MEIDNRLYQPLIIISNNNNKTAKRKRHHSANKRDLKTRQCGHFQKPAFWDFATHNKSNSNNVFMTNIALNEKEHNQFIMQDFSQYRKKPEQYLPKSEINKLFLEKISSRYKEPKKNNIRPRSSMHIYNNSDIQIERLFDKFYKADKARKVNSTGLGLFIVKKLMLKMNGNVEALLQDNKLFIKCRWTLS